MTKLTNNRLSPGFWSNLLKNLVLGWHLLKDERVPFWTKLIPVGVFLYLISPADFVPDIFPFLGQLDDLTLIILGTQVFIQLAPQELVNFHKDKIAKDK